jgi:hypothetical protein
LPAESRHEAAETAPLLLLMPLINTSLARWALMLSTIP